MIKPAITIAALLLSGAAMAENPFEQFVLDDDYPKDVLYCTETEAAGLYYEGGKRRWGHFERGRFTLKFSGSDPTYLKAGRWRYECQYEGRMDGFNEGAVCTNTYGAGQIILDFVKLSGIIVRISAAGVLNQGPDSDTHHLAAFTCEAF